MSLENQFHFEVIRDLIYMIGQLYPEEEITIKVKRQGNSSLLTWETSKGEYYGYSEWAIALKKAYKKSGAPCDFKF